MKHIILILIALSFFNCKAQIVTSLHKPQKYGTTGYYYKDLNNDHKFFEGTWKYTNSDTELIIVFEKKNMSHIYDDEFNINYYVDAIIGEYKYIENGIEQINTLSNINNNHSNPYDYNLIADTIYKFGDISCVDCEPENITIKGTFSQPDCDYPSTPQIIVRYYVENNVAKLSFLLMSAPYRGNPLGLEPQCQGFAIPYGYYTLIKQ